MTTSWELTSLGSARQGNLSKTSLTVGHSSKIHCLRRPAVSSRSVIMFANDHFLEEYAFFIWPICCSYSATSEADGVAGLTASSLFCFLTGGDTSIPALWALVGRLRFLNFMRSFFFHESCKTKCVYITYPIYMYNYAYVYNIHAQIQMHLLE